MTAQTAPITTMPKTNTFRLLDATDKRVVVMRGGTRSGKTYSILLIMCRWLFTGCLRRRGGDIEQIHTGVAVIVRKYAATLKGTVLRDFEQMVYAFAAHTGIVPDYNKTNKAFAFDGRTVEFIGADDEQKLRGRKSTILYCNEANELTYQREFFQLLIRCTGPVIMDFNPSDPYVWIKTEIEDKRAVTKQDVDVVVTTYKDNDTLKAEQIREIENLKSTNESLWRVYGLGEYGITEGLIIPNMTIIPTLPDLDYGCGLDFGFANSYTALYEVASDGQKLYTNELIYQRGLTDADIIEELERLNFPKSKRIVADSAQPGSIATLRRAGYNIKPVKKIRNSINIGLDIMRRLELVTTPTSEGLIREQKLYKYRQHANGEWLNEPAKGEDHAFDAIRYFCLNELGKKKTSNKMTRL